MLTTKYDLAQFSDGSGAKLKDAPVDIDLVDVTVCLKFYDFLRVNPKTTQKFLIHSKYDNETSSPIFAIGHSYDGPKWLGFQGKWTKLNNNIDWPIMTWNHVCWSFPIIN